jgi:hypothetical protein
LVARTDPAPRRMWPPACGGCISVVPK